MRSIEQLPSADGGGDPVHPGGQGPGARHRAQPQVPTPGGSEEFQSVR